MTYFSSLDTSKLLPVNNLWPDLINRIGVDKAHKAVHQAIDLQRMNGNLNTIPVLLFETCGLALVNIELVRKIVGFIYHKDGMVLILSTKESSVQLLHET